MQEFTLIQQLCIWSLPLLLAITLHEVAHGWVAYLFGDRTAKMLGRLSLNPLRHIDPIGTLALPLLLGILTQFNFIFGYAKPVPVNQNQLRHPRRDMIFVTLAGPLANFLMAFLWAFCFKLALALHPERSMAALFLLASARAGMVINLALGFLNLLPLPPLDGSRIVSNLLPLRYSLVYAKIEPYGFLILIALMVTHVLGFILLPLINYGFYFLRFVFNL